MSAPTPKGTAFPASREDGTADDQPGLVRHRDARAPHPGEVIDD